jgi:hypothetical protein
MWQSHTAQQRTQPTDRRRNGLVERTIATVEEYLKNSITYRQDIF